MTGRQPDSTTRAGLDITARRHGSVAPPGADGVPPAAVRDPGRESPDRARRRLRNRYWHAAATRDAALARMAELFAELDRLDEQPPMRELFAMPDATDRR